MSKLASNLTATFLDSLQTAGAFAFHREHEGGAWHSVSFYILDVRSGEPDLVGWIEPLDEEPTALNESTAALRDEFKDWVEKSKRDLPDEA